MVRAHDLPQLFGVEERGERGRIHEVTEHDGELTALGLRSRARLRSRLLLGFAPLLSRRARWRSLPFARCPFALHGELWGQRASTLATECKAQGVLKVALRAAK